MKRHTFNEDDPELVMAIAWSWNVVKDRAALVIRGLTLKRLSKGVPHQAMIVVAPMQVLLRD